MVHDPEDHVRDREEDGDTEKVFHPELPPPRGRLTQLYFSRVAFFHWNGFLFLKHAEHCRVGADAQRDLRQYDGC